MNDEPTIQIEWRVTTVMPRWIFDDAVASGETYHQAVAGFLTEKPFTYYILDDTFDHIESEIVEITVHE